MQQFDHEKLIVYQTSIQFVSWTTNLLERVPPSSAIYKQVDRASTSVPLNLAEGNGKFTEADRCRYFDIARGSALECVAALDVMVARRLITAEVCEEGKGFLFQIVSMLVGLIRANSSKRRV